MNSDRSTRDSAAGFYPVDGGSNPPGRAKRKPTSQRDREQRLSLCERQQWQCFFCQGRIVQYEMRGGALPDDAAVMVKLDSRLHFERGLHAGEVRRVAGCFGCATKRAKLVEATVPLAELHDRAQGRKLPESYQAASVERPEA